MTFSKRRCIALLSSFDLVFSNWLFMYLSDEETEQLLQKSLTWLAPGGTLFFRESCFHSSGTNHLLLLMPITFSPVHISSVGNIKPDENPTHYRSPRQYIDMCQSRILNGPTEQVYELVSAKALESYYEIKKNNNQVNLEENWKHEERIRFRFVFCSPKLNYKTIMVIKPCKIFSIIRSTRRKVFRSMNPFVVKGM